MATRPSAYINFTAAGVQPPSSVTNNGWSAGQSPVAAHFNYLFHGLDQWVQFLDSVTTGGNIATNLAASQGARLVGGGLWSFAASADALSWSSPFAISVPGVADSYNTVSAGSVTVASGQLAYVNAHFPVSVSGSTTSGSTIATVASISGIATGQTVAGPGIVPGTFVAAIPTGTSVTLSAAATATGSGAYLFTSTSSVSVQVADAASFIPSGSGVVFALRPSMTPGYCVVGVNSGFMAVFDGEARSLFNSGYVSLSAATAGQDLTAGQAVYVASPSDSGRTSGSVYPVDASAANGAQRAAFAGLAISNASSGSIATWVSAGRYSALSGLTPGAIYYASPTTPGAITTTRPTPGQYAVPVGYAVSSTVLVLARETPQLVLPTNNSWPNYAATTEAELTTVLGQAAAAGGGVILLANAMTLASPHTVPPYTVLVGRRGGAVVSLGASASIKLAEHAEIRDAHMVSAATTGYAVLISGSSNTVRDCKITVSASSTATAVLFDGASNSMVCFTQLVGVVGGTAVGIEYRSGAGNIDRYCTYS